MEDQNRNLCFHSDIEYLQNGNSYCCECGKEFLEMRDDCNHNWETDCNSKCTICSICGIVSESLDYSPEWRFYGAYDSRGSNDPTRCHKKSVPKDTVKSVFDKAGISVMPVILAKIQKKYDKVVKKTDNSMRRGNGRAAIIGVCYFYVLQEEGLYKTRESIQFLLGVNHRNMTEATTKYYLAFPEDRTKYITPKNLIPWVLEQVDISNTLNKDVLNRIYKTIDYLSLVSSDLTRSNPQSVAAAVVYFCICNTPGCKQELGLNKSKFAEKVKISDITITKLGKKIIDITQVSVSL